MWWMDSFETHPGLHCWGLCRAVCQGPPGLARCPILSRKSRISGFKTVSHFSEQDVKNLVLKLKSPLLSCKLCLQLASLKVFHPILVLIGTRNARSRPQPLVFTQLTAWFRAEQETQGAVTIKASTATLQPAGILGQNMCSKLKEQRGGARGSRPAAGVKKAELSRPGPKLH